MEVSATQCMDTITRLSMGVQVLGSSFLISIMIDFNEGTKINKKKNN